MQTSCNDEIRVQQIVSWAADIREMKSLLMHTTADLISSDCLEWADRIEVSESKSYAEEHGETLIDISFSNCACIQSRLRILTDVAPTINVSACRKMVGRR